MDSPIAEITNLSIRQESSFHSGTESRSNRSGSPQPGLASSPETDFSSDLGASILDSLDWSLYPGKIYSLIGESGSGKTSFALSLFGILPENFGIEYESFRLFGTDWKEWKSRGFLPLRGQKIALIPQNPHLSFHPYRKMGAQVLEFYQYTNPDMAKPHRIRESWENYGLRNPNSAYDSYPRSLSGGEKQRICIAMAALSGAQLLVADEPTTALDPIQEKKIVQYLQKAVASQNKTLLLVTHDLKLMQRIADEVLVIQSGKMVEKNTKGVNGFSRWESSYACELWRAVS